MKLTFYGGAGQVTGANYLLEIKDPSRPDGVRKILIDCGLHQGTDFCESHNYEPFAYNPKEVTEVFVTHAHIDHTGRLAKLIRDGFNGIVYSTAPTRDFAELLLLDSEHILADEALKHGKPVIYDATDVATLMRHWEEVEYHRPLILGNGAVKITAFSAGHILGSASYLIEAEGKSIIFSGDLGNSPAPLIGPTEAPTFADYCLIESAYGDRIHESIPERQRKLETVILDSVKAGGTLMIPAFALERTQVLLLEIKDMLEKHKIPRMPVFVDSPLAIKLTAVYSQYRHYLKKEIAHRFESKETIFDFPGLRMTPTVEDSKSINLAPNPKIVIAGSGMSHGGRILYHEQLYLSDPKSALLIFGYQAEGSLGRRLLNGASEVTIFGKPVQVRAKIKAIGAYSAHADQNQLLTWITPLKDKAKKVFVVQGEQSAATTLAQKITEHINVPAVVPTEGMSVEL